MAAVKLAKKADLATENVKASGAVGDGIADDTAALEEAIDTDLDLWFPEGIYLASASLMPADNTTWRGAGKGKTIIKVANSWAENGPVLRNRGDNETTEPIVNFTLEDMTIDGDYENNVEYVMRFELTDDITPASTEFEVDSTAGFPASGRLSPVVTPQSNDQVVTYTSKDATHFYGIVFLDNSANIPYAAPAGTEFRNRTTGLLGLVRFYTYSGFYTKRVDIINAGSYCVGLEGRPSQYDVEPAQIYPKENLRMKDGQLGPSFASDGIDAKDSQDTRLTGMTAYQCHDKGFNIRGRRRAYLNCVARECGNGWGETSADTDDNEPYTQLAVACSATATSIVVEDNGHVGFFSEAGEGWIGAEKFSWTSTTDNLDDTWTLGGVTRGIKATRATQHEVDGTVDPLVTEDIRNLNDDWEFPDGSVDYFNCWAIDNVASGMNIIAQGPGSRVRVSIHGGGGHGNNVGLFAKGGLGSCRLTMHSGEWYENDVGAKLQWLDHATLLGTELQENSEHGLYLLGNTNGVDLFGVRSILNGEYAIYAHPHSPGDYTNIEGGAFHGNGSGFMPAATVPSPHNTGKVFAAPSRELSAVPTAILAESLSRMGRTILATGLTLTSGRLDLHAIYLEAGTVITEIGAETGNAGATTPTHQWFCLYDLLTTTLLYQTTNDTTTAWAADTAKSLPVVGGPRVIPATGLYRIGVCVVAATPPNLKNVSGGTLLGRTPILAGQTPDTGLTATAPNPRGSIDNARANHGYVFVK